MKPSELMIGDWVYNALYADTHIPNKGHGWKKTVVNHIPFDEDWAIEPIPLTKKLLTLNRYEYDEQMNAMIFRFDSVETYIHIEYVFGINRIRVSVDKYRCGYAIDTEIRYVHELQNALRLCGLNELADNFKVEPSEACLGGKINE